MLFDEPDRFLRDAGGARDWPEGRGVYISENKRFIVWVNEEDHLKIISLQPQGKLTISFNRVARGVQTLT